MQSDTGTESQGKKAMVRCHAPPPGCLGANGLRGTHGLLLLPPDDLARGTPTGNQRETQDSRSLADEAARSLQGVLEEAGMCTHRLAWPMLAMLARALTTNTPSHTAQRHLSPIHAAKSAFLVGYLQPDSSCQVCTGRSAPLHGATYTCTAGSSAGWIIAETKSQTWSCNHICLTALYQTCIRPVHGLALPHNSTSHSQRTCVWQPSRLLSLGCI